MKEHFSDGKIQPNDVTKELNNDGEIQLNGVTTVLINVGKKHSNILPMSSLSCTYLLSKIPTNHLKTFIFLKEKDNCKDGFYCASITIQNYNGDLPKVLVNKK